MRVMKIASDIRRMLVVTESWKNSKQLKLANIHVCDNNGKMRILWSINSKRDIEDCWDLGNII